MGLWEVVSIGGLLVFERRRWNKEVHSGGALDGGGGGEESCMSHVELKKLHLPCYQNSHFPMLFLRCPHVI